MHSARADDRGETRAPSSRRRAFRARAVRGALRERAAVENAPRGLCADERGTVTAEFAIVLPAILVVLGLTIGGIFIAAHRITLASLAAQVSRLEARGDGDLAAAVLTDWGAQIEVKRSRSDGLHCVTLRSYPAGGLLAGIGVESLSCAAVSGEGSAA